MSYAKILERLPEDLRLPLLEALEAVKQELQEQFAVRREDIQGLIEAQKQTQALLQLQDERLARLEATVAELVETTRQLVETSKRHEEQLARLEATVAELVETVNRLVQAQEEQKAEMQRRFDEVEEEIKGIQDRLAEVDGIVLEDHYRQHAHAFFGRWLYSVRLVEWSEVENQLRATLSPKEYQKVSELDMILRGTWHETGKEIWVALEVSSVVDSDDVERAHERAALLRKAGWPAVPVAAGRQFTQGARLRAQELDVVLMQRGRAWGWQESLEAAGVV